MEALRRKRGFICDMDGVIYHGARMDTDIVAGIESGIDTAFVRSGITKESDLAGYACKPHYVLQDLGALSA